MNHEELKARVKKEFKFDLELAQQLSDKNTSLLRYLISTISVVFGILVSLSSNSSDVWQIRLIFAVSVALIALSILNFGACLYAEIYNLRKGRRLHAEETRKAYRQARPQEHIVVLPLKIFAVCEIIGYISFGMALLSLCVFVFLQAVYS
ncbi:MAG: hypothetical protein ACRCZB_02800 [Bacteroidales bacterium]